MDLPDGFLERWRVEVGELSEEEIEGLKECHSLIISRNLSSEEWFFDALNYVKRKKRDGSLIGRENGGNVVGYFIQILRNWVNYGRGNSGGWQDKVVMNLVEKRLKKRLNYLQKGKVYELMGYHGSLAVYVAVNEYKFDHGVSVDEVLEHDIPERIMELKSKRRRLRHV